MEHSEAVELRHVEIEDKHIGSLCADRVECLEPVDACRDNANARFLPEELREAGEDDRMIVGDDDADHTAAGSARNGTRMSSRTPLIAEEMSNVP